MEVWYRENGQKEIRNEGRKEGRRAKGRKKDQSMVEGERK